MRFFILQANFSSSFEDDGSQEAFYGSTVEKCVDFIKEHKDKADKFTDLSWAIYEMELDNPTYCELVGKYDIAGNKKSNESE